MNIRYYASTIIVVCVVIAKSYALRCHEGLNVTMGGIPMYIWSENDCKENENCLIQEIEIQEYVGKFGIVIRYGGCFSSQMTRILSCSTFMLRDVKIHEFKQLFTIIDDKWLTLSATISENWDHYKERILSKGNNVEEFFSGVIDFLQGLGYNAAGITEPLHQFMESIKYNGTDRFKEGVHLLSSLDVRNPTTSRLSIALIEFFSKYHDRVDGTPASPYHLRILSALPGLSYPILNAFTGYDTDHIFNMLSYTLEHTDFVPPQSDSETISMWLWLLQTFMAGLYDSRSPKLLPTDVIFEISKDILSRFRSVYPDNADIRFVVFASDAIYELFQKNKEECSDDAEKCNKRPLLLAQALLKKSDVIVNMDDPTEIIADIIDRVINYDVTEGIRQFDEQRPEDASDLQSILQSVRLEYFMHPEKFSDRRMFSHIFSRMERTLKEILDLMGVIASDEDAEIFKMPCQEYSCYTNLCNSHAAFDMQIRPQKRSSGRKPSLEL